MSGDWRRLEPIEAPPGVWFARAHLVGTSFQASAEGLSVGEAERRLEAFLSTPEADALAAEQRGKAWVGTP